MRVTSKTITNDQIWQLRESLKRIDSMFAVCDIATGARDPSPKAKTSALRSVEDAKASCARAWNARFVKSLAERRFRSHFPDSDIDSQKPTRISRRQYWVYSRGENHRVLGLGPTPARAWADACAKHGITAVKEGT